MNKIILGYWSSKMMKVRFDPESGRGWLWWWPFMSSSICGLACRHRGEWFLVWAKGDTLVFQAGKKHWSLLSDITIDNTLTDSGQKRVFSVTKCDGRVFELTYPSVVAKGLIARDPTFDSFDEEQEDFFLWLSRLSTNDEWKAGLIKRWSDRHLKSYQE
jgi:hypothetical protein